MNDEAGFLDAIRRDPADGTARLVYADWLDDRGDPRAEFLRTETGLLRAEGPNDPAALARWFELRDRVPADWVAALGPRVNGLPLPPDFADLLAAGRWTSKSEHDRFTSPWGEVYIYSSLHTMGAEIEHVGTRTSRLGRADPAWSPGDIDPRLTVLIGDEGLSGDSPFALDYREAFGRPRVLQYRWRVAAGGGTRHRWAGNRWVEVAPSFAAFWAQLG